MDVSRAAFEDSVSKITLFLPILTLPQGWAGNCVIGYCCIRVEQDARVSGFIECSCCSASRKRFSARPSDGKINALRIVLHTIRILSTMSTEHVSIYLK